METKEKMMMGYEGEDEAKSNADGNGVGRESEADAFSTLIRSCIYLLIWRFLLLRELLYQALQSL